MFTQLRDLSCYRQDGSSRSDRTLQKESPKFSHFEILGLNAS